MAKVKTQKAVEVDEVREAAEYAFASLQRVYSYLNKWAKGEHMKDWARVPMEGLIAQVYGDLAPAFQKLQKALAPPVNSDRRRARGQTRKAVCDEH